MPPPLQYPHSNNCIPWVISVAVNQRPLLKLNHRVLYCMLVLVFHIGIGIGTCQYTCKRRRIQCILYENEAQPQSGPWPTVSNLAICVSPHITEVQSCNVGHYIPAHYRGREQINANNLLHNAYDYNITMRMMQIIWTLTTICLLYTSDAADE